MAIAQSTPEQIMALYKGGLTYREIGEQEGVTRERIRQILRKLDPNFKTNRYAGTGKLNRIPRIQATCGRQGCHNVFTKLATGKKKWCSASCAARISPYHTSDPRYAEWRKEYQRKAAKEWYHGVLKAKPNWKEIVSERNKRYAAARKHAKK